MTDWQLSTPVVLIIFNRPDTTKKVFEAIRQAKPPKLLVIADGPRDRKPGEAEKCAATRAIIDRVDWDCEVLKNYSDVNIGCGLRVATGISWVFEQVEQAIILEDDCLPHPTFFRFCEELVNRYRYDTRVMHIAGSNYGIAGGKSGESYYFSYRTPIWGWATWRRAWQHYDFKMKLWPEVKDDESFIKVIGSQKQYKTRRSFWDEAYKQNIDTWDYQWLFTNICQGGYSIIPNVNLISNLGFNQDATHTLNSSSPFANLATYEMKFPLIHPQLFIKDTVAESHIVNRDRDRSFMSKAIKKLEKLGLKL